MRRSEAVREFANCSSTARWSSSHTTVNGLCTGMTPPLDFDTR
ncbi:hypothetical protein ACFQ6N_32180 [Kitasatospora sp. NPDC056446]